MIEIFSGRHGKPEGAFVAACRMMEDMAPAVLWFDEIEMGITSTESSGEQGRIFAFFLTWMQEKTRGLFVAATANRIDLLPAEMIRKGRFDEVFFVDLPQEEEHMEIFRIHLQRAAASMRRVSTSSNDPVHRRLDGRRDRTCVVSAITKARLADRDDHRADLITIAVKHCAAVANDEGADQSDPGMGVRAGGARVAAETHGTVRLKCIERCNELV